MYAIRIVEKTVDGDVWPTVYAYRPEAKPEGCFWLKMIQYISLKEMESNWVIRKEVSDGNDNDGVSAGDRPDIVGNRVHGVSDRGDVDNVVDNDHIKQRENPLKLFGKLDACKKWIKSSMEDPDLYLMLGEESAELAQACLKVYRASTGRNPTPHSLEVCKKHAVEELTDVWLCAFMLGIFPDDSLAEAKAGRWVERLEASGLLPKGERK